MLSWLLSQHGARRYAIGQGASRADPMSAFPAQHSVRQSRARSDNALSTFSAPAVR